MNQGRPGPVQYSPTETPDPEDYDAPNKGIVESVPVSSDNKERDTSPDTSASVTPSPTAANVESVPVGVQATPMDLAPLPTTQSKTPHLDVSHGGAEEGGQVGSGQGERSGEGGSSDDGASGTVLEPEGTPTQAEVRTTSGLSELLQAIPDHVTPDPLATEAVLPAGVKQVGRDPALVFKEGGATLSLDLEQSPPIAADKNATALAPIHVIIVNVSSQIQSGE